LIDASRFAFDFSQGPNERSDAALFALSVWHQALTKVKYWRAAIAENGLFKPKRRRPT
jgi:hypothetical protein